MRAQLHLETGYHTAPIRCLACDVTEQLCATGSDDKTVRIWKLPQGQLQRVLYPPFDTEDTGKIYAMTFSPDSQWIAAGGQTYWTADKQYCVYIFSVKTGHMVHCLTGFPGSITGLAFSHSGHQLGVTFRYGGVAVWSCQDWSESFRDLNNSGGSSCGLAFDAQEHLITTSDDGCLRLYNNQGTLLAKTSTTLKHHPCSLACCGKYLALGYSDGIAVSVYEIPTLREVRHANCQGLRGKEIGCVAWSRDERYLYGGGGIVDDTGTFLLRCWSDQGQTIVGDFPVATNTIMALQGYGHSGVLCATATPNVVFVDVEQGIPRVSISSLIPDLRNALDNRFAVADDGDVVLFPVDTQSTQLVMFDVTKRKCIKDPNPALHTHLSPAHTQAQNLNIQNWQDHTQPSLSGQPLPLPVAQKCHALTIAKTEMFFICGTNQCLLMFDGHGRCLWRKDVFCPVWGVVLAEKSRLIVAALADGTLRWYRQGDGEEVCALFVPAPYEQWILWTPEGFYDSTLARDLVLGWRISEGRSEGAEFFSMACFGRRFFSPLAIDRLFDHHKKTIDVCSIRPPILTILDAVSSVEKGSAVVTVAFSLRAQSSESLVRIKAFADGIPLTQSPFTLPDGDNQGIRHLRFEVPTQTQEITMLPEQYPTIGMTSRLSLQGLLPTMSALPVVSALQKPVLSMLAVGANGFFGGENTLQFAIKDAQDVSDRFARQITGLYRSVRIEGLHDGKVTRERILRGLEKLGTQVTQDDVTVLFMAGHGINDSLSGIYYYLPDTGDLNHLPSTAISSHDIVQALSNIPGKRIAFLDTCHAGNMLGVPQIPRSAARRFFVNLDALVLELSSAENGVIAFASSTGEQDSLESREWQNGAFTKALVEAIEGFADTNLDRAINISELGVYIKQRVKDLTNGRQSPNVLRPHSIRDFPLVLVVPTLP